MSEEKKLMCVKCGKAVPREYVTVTSSDGDTVPIHLECLIGMNLVGQT